LSNTKLKNKALISFSVNLLIGIIFSFPVLTASSGVSAYLASPEAFESAVNVIDVDQNVPVFVKLLNSEEPAKLNTCKTETRNRISGNKNNSKYVSEGLVRSRFEYPLFISDFITKHLSFVNLSYLKELRTTKMLC